MKYNQWIHGVYRNHPLQPSGKEVWEKSLKYRREHPEEFPSDDQSNRIRLYVLVLIEIIWIILLMLQKIWLSMIVFALPIVYWSLHGLFNKHKSELPKYDKNPYCNITIALISSLAVIVYSTTYLMGYRLILPHKAIALLISWIGLSYMVTSVWYGVIKNIKCTKTTDATCIGYADTTVSYKRGRDRHVTVTKCVYKFTYEGKKYIVPGTKKSRKQNKLPEINSTNIVRFNPDNPEYCMVKKAEIEPIVRGILTAFVCLGICWMLLTGDYSYGGKNESSKPDNVAETRVIYELPEEYRVVVESMVEETIDDVEK